MPTAFRPPNQWVVEPVITANQETARSAGISPFVLPCHLASLWATLSSNVPTPVILSHPVQYAGASPCSAVQLYYENVSKTHRRKPFSPHNSQISVLSSRCDGGVRRCFYKSAMYRGRLYLSIVPTQQKQLCYEMGETSGVNLKWLSHVLFRWA